MKKIALITCGLLATNVAANICINTLRASGGTASGLAFIGMPYLTPAPLFYKLTAASAA